jgi:SAM-dependent methyltransferase
MQSRNFMWCWVDAAGQLNSMLCVIGGALGTEGGRPVAVDAVERAINGAYVFCEEQQALLDQGLITEEQWFANQERYFADLYLSTDNPRMQSGHGGDEARYRYTQEMILDAIHGDGTFIDIGCANGLLMERLRTWSVEKGHTLEFYGLDISDRMVALAKRRLPHWKDRFYVGNALNWNPPMRFTYVCVKELDYVPRTRRKELFTHLLDKYVQKGGRLILGPWTERSDEQGIGQETTRWGYPPSGSSSKPHQDQPLLIRRVHWYEVSP